MAEKSGIEQRQHVRVNDFSVFKYYEPGSNFDLTEEVLAKIFFSESKGQYYALCKELHSIDKSTKILK